MTGSATGQAGLALADVRQHPDGLRLAGLEGGRLDEAVTTPSGKVELMHSHIVDDIPRLAQRLERRVVLDIGTEHATMSKVATRLGASLPGLYHHVKNRDELLRLAAQGALVDAPPLRYRGEHWAAWLGTYATYVRSALAAEPALVEKFVSGRVADDGQMEYIAQALDALHDQGLQHDQALSVWAAITALATGSVTEAHRERIQADQGRPWLSRIFALTARSGPTDHPALRAVARSGYDPFGDEAFDERITLLLSGIAANTASR